MSDRSVEPPFQSQATTPLVFGSTAERLRWKAQRIGPFGLDYITAGELLAIADELESHE